MNILVTGANGQLGNEMRIVSLHSSHRFIFTDITDFPGLETRMLDITDLDAVRMMVEEEEVDAIVNCAAYTNVDAAETNEPLAQLLNAQAPENLAIAMSEKGGLLIHISTDYVFGHDPYNTPCSEDKTGRPTGVYGRTKKEGEERIARVFQSNISTENVERGLYVILRTAWLYSEFGKNFCKTMLQLTSSKPSLQVVFDQCGTPTYALDLANAILKILDMVSSSQNRQEFEGIYHYSNEGICSWYDFTKMIQQIAVDVEKQNPSANFGNHSNCEVLPCHSNEFPSPVVRPSYSVLDKSKIKRTFGLSIPYWTDSLRKCIERLAQ